MNSRAAKDSPWWRNCNRLWRSVGRPQDGLLERAPTVQTHPTPHLSLKGGCTGFGCFSALLLRRQTRSLRHWSRPRELRCAPTMVAARFRIGGHRANTNFSTRLGKPSSLRSVMLVHDRLVVLLCSVSRRGSPCLALRFWLNAPLRGHPADSRVARKPIHNTLQKNQAHPSQI